MAPYTIGVDIGTTGLKAVVLDLEQGVVAHAERPHELLSSHPGWAEEDAEQWWITTVSAIQQLLNVVPASAIAAIGVSGMVPAMVLLDASGQPLRPSIQQNDARAGDEVEELRASIDVEAFFRITGGVPNQQNIAPRWRWLARHEPDVIARTAHLLGSYDFISYCLTGEYNLEENWAAESGLYDILRRRWHMPYLEQAGITADQLPPVRRPTAVIGGVSDAAASATGLIAGTPVLAGSADHVAAALAAGLTTTGDVLLKFGGAGDILYCAESPDPDKHFYFDYHDIPGLVLINGCMVSSGSLVKWFTRELANSAQPEVLDAEAALIGPGAGGIVALPYFLGEKTPIFDPMARGIFAGVMLHHTRAHLYRAVLESVCYGFAHHLALLREAGRPITRVLAADGGSRSAVWMQIAADVVGEPVSVVGGEAASALGVAFVAAMGAGMATDWTDIRRYSPVGAIYQPHTDAHAAYQQGFALYRELYRQMQPLLPALGTLEQAGTELVATHKEAGVS
ncbi:MAG TPA: FGGY family carbohydrate kinase [Ktedonobacterales bacterium]|nr:FGGY family carbohydrate kinase [Ktedonobacterales bacterium]